MSVAIVAFMPANWYGRPRVRTLFIYADIYLFFVTPCSASLYFECATHTFALFSGVVI